MIVTEIPKSRFQSRRGTTLLECTVALLVLSMAMLGLAQLLAAANSQRRLTTARSMALQELANQAERVAALPWDDTAAEKLTTWQPSTELTTAIPTATCRAAVADEAADGIPVRRIRLEIAWPDAAGREQQPATLTVWRHRPEVQP
jgi:Tfp pilus assembly protein PilV